MISLSESSFNLIEVLVLQVFRLLGSYFDLIFCLVTKEGYYVATVPSNSRRMATILSL